MGSSLRPGQWLEEKQHQCEELWTDDSQLQSPFPLQPLPGEWSQLTFCPSQSSLWLKTSLTTTRSVMTHRGRHLCESSMSKQNKLGCCSAATKHTETCHWHWRGGWRWIIQFSTKRQPVFGHARSCWGCQTSLGEKPQGRARSSDPGER